VLFQRKGTPCRPFLIGGHQESGRRAGTEKRPLYSWNRPGALLAMANIEEEERRVRGLRDRLEAAIVAQIPEVAGEWQGCSPLPNTLNVSIHYIEGEGMLYQLSDEGICASSGSACTSGSLEPSMCFGPCTSPSRPSTARSVSASAGSTRTRTSTASSRSSRDRGEPAQAVPYWDNERNRPRPARRSDTVARTSSPRLPVFMQRARCPRMRGYDEGLCPPAPRSMG